MGGQVANMTICSQCGVQKREVNHWWFLWLERCGVRLCLLTWDADPDLQYESSVQKLCGMSCVSRAVSEFMEEICQKPVHSK